MSAGTMRGRWHNPGAKSAADHKPQLPAGRQDPTTSSETPGRSDTPHAGLRVDRTVLQPAQRK
ncbi:protein of unknown function (plasmid) [Cupriavidus taiwanensis]|uniref:Uncharacterized protein n=1 Tax=Cupriavidus taiwanensis TaxID=164546 RepID=A0A375IRR1_9BURK|nr:protein of unknown function [Cupriavidus taiwanensis]